MSERTKAALAVIGETREILTLARQAMYDTRKAWAQNAVSEGMSDDLVTIWASRALGMATEHVALISKFLGDVSHLVSLADTDKLEMLIRTGVEHWGEQVEAIRRADEAWRRGEHVRLGRKR